MKYAKTIGAVLLLASLLAACGGGDGGGGFFLPQGGTGSAPGPTYYPPTIVDCLGAGSTGAIAATVLFPNGTTPVAAVTTTISIVGEICVPGPFGVPICTPVVLPLCSGDTSTAGTIEFRNVPAETVSLSAKKGMFSVSQDVTVSAGATASASLAFAAAAKLLGVVAGEYDWIEDVLTRLGFAWEYITKTDLTDSAVLNTYDGVFLNCGLDQVDNPSDLSLDEATANTVAANLQGFLNSGKKRLYVSDWAYIYLEKAFPTMIDFYGTDTNYDYNSYDQPRIGIDTSVTASINTATGLDEALGGRSSIGVVFDLSYWVVVNSVDPSTTVLISADVTAETSPTTSTTVNNSPLAVKFPYGSSGQVVYTSFHNEAQPTADMDKMLEYFIME